MFQIITLYLTLINIKERVIDIAAKKIKQAEMAEMLGLTNLKYQNLEKNKTRVCKLRGNSD